MGGAFRGIIVAGRETEHSGKSSAEVNALSYAPTPIYIFLAWNLIASGQLCVTFTFLTNVYDYLARHVLVIVLHTSQIQYDLTCSNSGGKLATNRLSYGTANPAPFMFALSGFKVFPIYTERTCFIPKSARSPRTPRTVFFLLLSIRVRCGRIRSLKSLRAIGKGGGKMVFTVK
jgi:hypothetical protein